MSKNRTLCDTSCLINFQLGGDHAYCECKCHRNSLPAIPPSRKRRVIVKGRKIKELLMNVRLVLCNSENRLKADYRISAKGVPYVEVFIKNERYSISFFGQSQKFRVFYPDQTKVDVDDKESLIKHMISLKGDSK